MSQATAPSPTTPAPMPLDMLESRRVVRSRSRVVLTRLRSNRLALVGVVIIAFLAFIAVFGPALAPHDPLEMTLAKQFMPPSREHWMGTDDFGRDILSRLMYGSRQSLMVGIVSITIGALVGMSIGLVSGYFGGRIDMASQRFIDIMLAFPDLLLALAIVAILGPSLVNVMIAVGIGSIPVYARLIRGQVLSLKEKEYVEAARASGARPGRIIFTHILPNSLSPLIVLASLGIASAILTGAALSFIGMGAQPPAPEWGAMLSSGRSYLRHEWWIATFPGLALTITAFGFNLLGDGLRDALDPRTQD
jgi:peptide/nickel transport system permease protein